MKKKVIIKLECLARRYSGNNEQKKTFFNRFQDKFLDEYSYYRKIKIKENRALEIALKNTEYKIVKQFEKPNQTNYFLDNYIWFRKNGFNEKESEKKAKSETFDYFKVIAEKIIEGKLK